MQIRADFRSEPGDRASVPEVALQSGLERRVITAEINLGIEPVDVPGRIRKGRSRALQPEELPIRDAQHIVALETLARSQWVGLELCGLGPGRFQTIDLFRHSGRAPVRHLPVEFMSAGLHGEKRFGPEHVLDELRGKAIPGGLRLILRMRRRCGNRRGRLPGAGRCRCHQQDEKHSDGKGLTNHSGLH